MAASGVVAMAMLTACNGDDDNKSLTPPPMPTFSVPKIDIPDIDIPDPSDLPTSTKRPTSSSSRPTGGATSSTDEVESVDLEEGECIDTSSSGEISKKSCSGPHMGEVGAVVTLPDSPSPTSPDFEASIESKCEDEVMPIINRQSNASALTFSFYYPQFSSWTSGDRTLQCIIEREDGAKLTAKLK
ncbi:septum formation family protein [Streptodolium elevatio]